MLNGFLSALMVAVSFVASSTIQSNICTPPSAPTITEPLAESSITTGSPFTVSGDGEPDVSIILSSNNTDILTLQADESNRYYGNFILSEVGSHTIDVRTVGSCGSAVGESVTIIALANPGAAILPAKPDQPARGETPSTPVTSDEQNTSRGLVLSIDSPKNNSTTRESSVFISGSTSVAATVTIAVDGEIVGSSHVPRTVFGMSAPLEVGENTVVVSAASAAGTADVKLVILREHSVEKVAWYQTEPAKAIVLVAITSMSALAFFGIVKRIRLGL